MFDKKFVSSLPKDPAEAINLICDEFIDFHERLGREEDVDYYEEYLTAYSLLIAFLEVHKFDFDLPPITRKKKSDVNMIYDSFLDVRSKIAPYLEEKKYSLSVEEFKAMLGNVFYYQFSNDDLKRIEKLLDNLKDVLRNDKDMGVEFRHRILKKVTILKDELNRKTKSVDGFWGLFVDGGVALGKFGDGARLFFNTVKDIILLVWQMQAKAEELPPNAPVPMIFTGRSKKV